MKKPIPIAFTILSLVYLFYVINSDRTGMIGDNIKGDPGNFFLPIMVAVTMFFSSVYLLFKQETEVGVTIKESGAFYLTLVLSILYVLMFRYIGFLLITNLLFFTLSFFYYFKLSRPNLKLFAVGLLTSTGFLFMLYTISRYISRFIVIYSRNIEINWMRSSFFLFFINLTIVILLIFPINKLTMKKYVESKIVKTKTTIFLSVSSSILLYLVFNQLFNVNLVRGLIWF